MIAQYLKSETESATKKIIETNRLMLLAQNGTLQRMDVENYLKQLSFLFSWTPPFLQLAHDVAQKQGQPVLAEFMKNKIPEESGHDQWAKNDLKKQGFSSEVSESDLSPSLRALLRFVDRAIREDAANYLSYMFFVEYMTVLAGPRFLDALEKRCGIPRSSMTAIGNHVELDPDHSQETLDLLATLNLTNETQARMKFALDETVLYVHGFLENCVISTAQKMPA